jgi:hypothetical protein
MISIESNVVHSFGSYDLDHRTPVEAEPQGVAEAEGLSNAQLVRAPHLNDKVGSDTRLEPTTTSLISYLSSNQMLSMFNRIAVHRKPHFWNLKDGEDTAEEESEPISLRSRVMPYSGKVRSRPRESKLADSI